MSFVSCLSMSDNINVSENLAEGILKPGPSQRYDADLLKGRWEMLWGKIQLELLELIGSVQIGHVMNVAHLKSLVFHSHGEELKVCLIFNFFLAENSRYLFLHVLGFMLNKTHDDNIHV